MKTKSDN